MTPCGAEPSPRATCRVRPVSGSSQPSSPDPCAVYQTPPSRAGATSWGLLPAGTRYSRTLSAGVELVPSAAEPARPATRAATARIDLHPRIREVCLRTPSAHARRSRVSAAARARRQLRSSRQLARVFAPFVQLVPRGPDLRDPLGEEGVDHDVLVA